MHIHLTSSVATIATGPLAENDNEWRRKGGEKATSQ